MRRMVFLSCASLLVVVPMATRVEAQPAPPTAVAVATLQPAEGEPGTEVVVRGAGFGTDRRGVAVTLGGRPVSVRSVTPGEIRFTVPPGAVSGPVVVRVGRAQAASAEPFRVVVPVRVVSFTPDRGAPGSEVTVTGEGFATPATRNRVTLTGVPCPVSGGDETTLRIRIPPRAVTGQIEVEAGPGRRATTTRPFVVEGGAPPPPTATGAGRPVIDRVEPAAGPPGTVVRIFGRNFEDRDEVWFSGRRLETIERLPGRLTVEIPAGARTGTFSIRGRFTAESRQRFEVREERLPPVVTSFSPTEGPPGTLVTIVGQRFGDRSFQNRVMLGGQPCVVRTASPTQLTVEVPSGAVTSPFSVQVTGAGEAQSPSAFRVFTELSIASVEPVNGPEGTRVTIRGTGFVPDARQNTVTINARPVRVLTAGETELVVEIPRGATSGPVEVTSRGVRRRARDPFVVTRPPVVQRFSPASGTPGTEVTIYGSNFGDARRGLRVSLGETECRVLSVGPTQVRVTVPAGASSGPFEVTVHSQGSHTSPAAFSVIAPLTIARFAPTLGPAGTEVTVTGTGFSPVAANNGVFVGGRPAQVLAAGATELRIAVPQRVAGGTIRVQVRGVGTAESEEAFVVQAVPVVRRFSPAGGPPGSEVVLEGDNFGTNMGDVRVTLSGQPCPLTAVGPTRIALRIPDRASSGRFQITVAGHGSGESSTDFEVVAPLTVSGFAPSGGGPNTDVTITGSGFGPRTRDNEVFLGETPVRVLAARPDELRVRVPAGATTGRFRVRTAGRGESVSPTAFRVQVALSIESVEPATGQPGPEVRLVGRGFGAPRAQVLLAGTRLTHTTVSDTEIRVTVPPGARSGPFVVRVPRMGEARSRGDFTVTDPPVLTSMSPVTGPVGTVVTLQGRNFSPNMAWNRVTLNGVECRIEAVSPAQMRVRIPSGAASGRIRVEVRGAGSTETPMPFALTGPSVAPAPAPTPTPAPPTAGPPAPPLVVQGFSPRAGAPGTMVQILGDGFGAAPQDLRVWIGAQQVPIVGLEGRMLTVQVPPSASSGPIRVFRAGPGGGSTVETPAPFTVQR